MSKPIKLSSLVASGSLLAALLTSGCGDTPTPADSADAGSPDATPDYRGEVMAAWSNPCTDTLESVYESVAAPDPWTPEQRGTIVRCAYDRRISIEEMQDFIDGLNYSLPSYTTAVHKVRISYWTERNPGEPVITSGALFIPEELRATPSPLVVFGHPSVGIADICAPSREDPNGYLVGSLTMVYTLASDGWLVVMPDFPGLGTPGAHAWTFSPDEGHSLLDATRAVRQLGDENIVGSRNLLVGHSAGGHAVLSAHSYLEEYGAQGSIDGVLAFAPFWVSNAAWGALISTIGDQLMNPAFMAMTITYFYGHLAVYEGDEHRLDAFLPEKRDAIENMFENSCWSRIISEKEGPGSIGLDIGPDAFTAEYVSQVGDCGLADQCNTELAQAWRERWVIDRPTPNPTVPVVQFVGARDSFLLPNFQMCGIDRLMAQGANLSVCVDGEAGHSDVVPRNATWMRQYLAHRLLDEPAPEACAGLDSVEPALHCELPIANRVEPEYP